MYKIDLHTHSVASPDGGLSVQDYQRMLASGLLDFIAVTDHDRIDFAQQLHKQLVEQIIVGEEISTKEGELIGLYLTKQVMPGMSAIDTAKTIHAQGGLVYVPHPFETVRKGLPLAVLEQIASEVDIVETRNGRAVFQNRSTTAEAWATQHNAPKAASSDAHGKHGWGKTHSTVSKAPTKDTLPRLLRQAVFQVGSPGVRGVLYPKVNRLRKKISHA